MYKIKVKLLNTHYFILALDSLGYADFRKEAENVMQECRNVAAKRRRQSTRLENLGIPEEELLRQQQELFAKAREQQLEQERQIQLNQTSIANHTEMPPSVSNDIPSTETLSEKKECD